MVWSERQQAMLQAMGLRLWGPTAIAGPAADERADAPADAGPAAVAVPSGSGMPASGQTEAPLRAPRAVPDADVSPPAARAGRVSVVSPAELPVVQPAARPSLDGIAPDWAGLEAQVAACTACGLCEGRRQTVFGVGDRQARVMVIGEAPGEHEDRQGEPFVGKAGQLLDRMLAAVGHRRGEGDLPRVYIANTLKCRPPGNRNPTPDELARCMPYLLRQIELVRPRLILALGAFAVRAVLRQEAPIGRLRGSVHTAPWPGEPGPGVPAGLPVVGSYHPSYLLRQPTEKAKAWADLCLAMDTLQKLAPADPTGP